MSDEESDLFKAAMGEMGGVKRIRRERRVDLKKEAPEKASLKARREAATAMSEQELNPLSGEFVEQVHPRDPIEFKRDGVQNGVYRNLRLGKYTVDARLDLHNHSVDRARTALFEFVRDCLDADIRCALITHGKGEGRQNPALLKSCINHWLPQLEEVLAFHSAQKQHGGMGATYVLLRKSDKKKLETLERHQKRLK